ncbi:MAG: hypothetical protein U5K38_02900 [Woeseiaceae bacterium]|nr:hypothetical protein [Woeseiaceae bacterium]
MSKKLTDKALEKFEAERDVWLEVLEGVREIKAGGGKRKKVAPESQVARVRLKSGLSQAEFASVSGFPNAPLSSGNRAGVSLQEPPKLCFESRSGILRYCSRLRDE